MLGFFKDGLNLGVAGFKRIYGQDGKYWTPYLTRVWIGRLRLHIFHRGDADEDCHDHPWDFWTFPLTSYVEEVVNGEVARRLHGAGWASGFKDSLVRTREIVRAFKIHHRPATHSHRVLGAWDGTIGPVEGLSYEAPRVDLAKQIVTVVWVSKPKRPWGFLKNRDGKWCWIAWRDYVFNGGKEGPCQ